MLRIGLMIMGAVGLSATVAAGAPPSDIEFFEQKIRPVLVEHCYGCHSSSAKSVKGGLLLDTKQGLLAGGDSGPALVPGDTQASLLLSALRYEDFEMPPKGQLPESVVSDFAIWIRAGAPDPRRRESQPTRDIDVEAGRQFWSFRPLVRPPTPHVEGKQWPLGEIDQFVLHRLEREGLLPVGDADKLTWLRRVTFDLVGLPPSAAEQELFIADETSDAKRRVVERLLSSRHFGEYWGRHWLDVARFAESTGRTRNYPYPFAWRYRDYVIDSFNEDKPYDQFIVEQLAGDLLPYDSHQQFQQQQIATGFLALGSPDLNERDRDVYRMDVVSDQIDTMSRGMLALTVGCARCHDHKFDPIPTADYYALAGIFRSTDTLNGYANRVGGGNGYVRPELVISIRDPSKPMPRREEPVSEDEKLTRGLPKAQAKRLLQAKQQRDAAADKLRQLRKNKDLAPAAKTRQLAAAKKQLNNKTRQFRNLQNRFNRNRRIAVDGPACLGVRDSKSIADCRIHIRGDVKRLGDEVPRGFLQVLNSSSERVPEESSGRLQLARWIANPNNPLTARVMVNRVWYHLFGQGLVRTVDNFGAMGAEPTHPELLDYLADQFIASGWSVKQMIREIVLSRTYGLATTHDPHNATVDGGNDLFWRMNLRRLSFESMRDAMLASSGELCLSPPSGSPIEQLTAGELGRRQSLRMQYDEFRHRSVYLPIVRSQLPTSMVSFDFPESTEVRGARDVTTVPTQSLYLLNSKFVIGVAARTADLLLSDDSLSDEEIAKQAVKRLFSRDANDQEVERLVEYNHTRRAAKRPSTRHKPNKQVLTRRDAWAEAIHAMLASADFRYR